MTDLESVLAQELDMHTTEAHAVTFGLIEWIDALAGLDSIAAVEGE